MKNYKLYYLSILILFIGIISSCGINNKLSYNEVITQKDCSQKDGFWYNNKCWKDYSDEGISNEDIDSVVTQQMKVINKTEIIINDSAYPIRFFIPEIDKKNVIIILVYEKQEKLYSMVIPDVPLKELKAENDSIPVNFMVFDINLLEPENANSLKIIKHKYAIGKLIINVLDFDNLDLICEGIIKENEKESETIIMNLNEAISGAGMSKLEIKGNEAYLSGTLGTIAYVQIKDMINQHPEVKTLVLTNVAGSVNDAVNMHTGRILRKAGLNTKVLSNSEIASGGVDLFCAGNERIVEQGAKIGIHSWCCVNDVTAAEIPKEHPAHMYQIEYFTMCLGSDLGPKFILKPLKLLLLMESIG